MTRPLTVKRFDRRMTKPHFVAMTVLGLVGLVACGPGFAVKKLDDPAPVLGAGAAPTPTPTDTFSTPVPPVDPTPTPTPVGATPEPTPTPIQANLKVMTYDIHAIPCLKSGAISSISSFFGVEKCPLVNDSFTQNNSARIDALISRIQSLRAAGEDPDVIFLQEAYTMRNSLFDDDAVKSIPSRSGYAYSAWGPESLIDNGVDDYWNLIFHRTDKLRGLTSSGLLILSKHPIRNTWTTSYSDICEGNDCYDNRGIVMAKVFIASINQEVDLANTHSQSGTSSTAISIRSMQSDVLTSFVQMHASAKYRVVGANFNARLQNNEAGMTKTLTGMTAKDGGKECVAAGAASCTIIAGTSTTQLSGDSLDHILFSEAASYEVDPVRGEIPVWPFGAGGLSNHDPLVISFELSAPPF